MLKPENNPTCKKIAFFSDEFLLQGILHLPAADRPPVVIGSHGLFSSSSSPKQVALAQKCIENGIAFFRFDHRGCGQSQGDFKKVTSLESRCVDLISAVKTIRSRTDTGDRLGLFGSSMGGAVCIYAANLLDVKALVTVAAPVRSSSVVEALNKSKNPDSLLQPFDLKYLRSDISDKLAGLHHILIFHGQADHVVPPSNAQEIYSKAAWPKKLIMQKDGDHPMSKKEHQENFVKEAVNWYKTCFEES
ncbi:MAG: lysophospholipase [Proteobacteria bacterium]|nr:lysophospholipase [Pseudomonadota bacterium]